MENILQSIKAHLYDRTTSPLSGAFLISWGIWNYKFIVVLFSSLSVDEKFEYISSVLYVTWLDYSLTGVVFPLITTVFLLFVYPYPSKLVYEFWRNRQKELKEIKQKIEDETPLTIEETREVRRLSLQLEIEYEKSNC